MRIHFIGAVRGNQGRYNEIIAVIESLGWQVITNHSATRKLSDILQETDAESAEYTKQALGWIKQADIVIVEASCEDISIGVEATIALQHSKPIIFLFDEKNAHAPFTMKGYSSNRVQLVGYSINSIKTELKHALSYASEQLDIRFNMLLSPNLMTYLEHAAQKENIPKSVFIRNLLKEHQSRYSK